MIMGTACGSRFPSAIAFIAPRLAPGHAARDAGRQRWIQTWQTAAPGDTSG